MSYNEISKRIKEIKSMRLTPDLISELHKLTIELKEMDRLMPRTAHRCMRGNYDSNIIILFG